MIADAQRRWPELLSLVVPPLALFAAVSAPLLTYATTLALFGPAHVLSELRYVERQFAGLFLGTVGAALLSLLGGVALIRGLRVAGILYGPAGIQLELGVVAALALTVLALGRRRLIAAGLCAGLVLGGGLVVDPYLTILLLACLHNWTPVGFLRAAPGGGPWSRTRLGLLFVVAPLVIATGLPRQLLALAGAAWPELDWLTGGELRQQYAAYLPPWVHERPWAQDLFSALVFCQCLHYLVVLTVLPRLDAPRVAEAPRLLTRWAEPDFNRLLFLSGGATFVLFFLNFSEARNIYSIPAAVHAWVELPVLLVALLPAGRAAARPG